MYYFHLFETAHGFAAIAWNERGISGFRLPASTPEDARRAMLRRLPDATLAEPPEPVVRVIAAAVRYFEGEAIDFSDVPLDLGQQEPLFARIYYRVRRLGRGEPTP